jgi:hypothetical protein
MRASIFSALTVGAVLFGLAPAAAGEGLIVPGMSSLNRADFSAMRVLSPSGYTSRANSGEYRCPPVASSSGAFDDAPEIVRFCIRGDQ